MKATCAVIALSIAVAGCSQHPADEYLRSKVNGLELELAAANDRISAVETKLSDHNRMHGETAKVYLDPLSDGYTTARTDIGPLLLSVVSSVAKADGTEVMLQIGNPTTGTLAGVMLDVDYNQRVGEGKDWAGSMKSTKYRALTPIRGGSWTSVTVPLPGIKPDQLGYMAIAVATNEIQLNNLSR